MVLEKINYPSDLKNLNIEEMNTLSDEMRDLIIKKVNSTGRSLGTEFRNN